MKRAHLFLLAMLLLSAVGWADTEIASDHFTRADGPLGSNWTGYCLNGSCAGTWAISSDTAIVSGPINNGVLALWTANTFSNDQYSTFTQAAWDNSSRASAGVRLTSTGNGYILYCSSSAAGLCYQFRLYLISGAALATMLESINPDNPIAGGTNVTLKVAGSGLSVWVAGAQIDTGVTDATYSTGRPGLFAGVDFTATNGVTYWEGGNVGGGGGGGGTANIAEPVAIADSITPQLNGGPVAYARSLLESVVSTPSVIAIRTGAGQSGSVNYRVQM